MSETSVDSVAEILSGLPAGICDLIVSWAERTPDHAALVETSGTWSYRQLADAVSETQGWLRDLGVRPGDRVMVVCENCRALVAILFALARVGQRAFVGARNG
jgi:acyl-CoA synthetase (AMP-forming)/AMP-acid ligase II